MSSASRPNRGQALREIPSVSAVLEEMRRRGVQPIDERIMTSIVQRRLIAVRQQIESGSAIGRFEILQRCEDELKALLKNRLKPVINATGVILHTNLGRAPVSAETAEAMALAASSSIALEIDSETNERGGRMDEISRLMRSLTGAECSLVVNNNAAAVLLVLSALAAGQEVIVSRGEAVEIGGGFRIPDVLDQSGATMIEVGTTNRTYASDYRHAISGQTVALLTVHTSNFRVEGFVASPTIGELVNEARETSLLVIDDLGSGSILSPEPFGLAAERTIGASISAGVDIVTASGDKLLGGPQAGLICGRSELVALIEKHPFARAVRADKATLAGVAETLRHYVRGEALSHIPVWKMIAASEEELHHRAVGLQEKLISANTQVNVVPLQSTVGGGSLPGETMPSWGLAFEYPRLDDLAARLRTGEPGIFGRITAGQLTLDLRTVPPESDIELARALNTALDSTMRNFS